MSKDPLHDDAVCEIMLQRYRSTPNTRNLTHSISTQEGFISTAMLIAHHSLVSVCMLRQLPPLLLLLAVQQLMLQLCHFSACSGQCRNHACSPCHCCCLHCNSCCCSSAISAHAALSAAIRCAVPATVAACTATAAAAALIPQRMQH
jgi:hypothetical protein